MTMEVRHEDALKTWQYLRVAIILLVLGIGASIAYEVAHAGHCMQHSISGYYYTPVRGFLVGALVAIGVCLVALKGRPVEDVLLNLAGAFAPVVALVPTPNVGDCHVDIGTSGRSAYVANNMTALLVISGVALAVTAWLVLSNSDEQVGRHHAAGYGLLLAVVAWLLALIVFGKCRTLFLEEAHNVAAVGMFLLIGGVVLANAIDRGSWWRNRYGVLFWLMVASAVAAAVGKADGWQHAVFGIEAAMITLFAVFWVIQTVENWNETA